MLTRASRNDLSHLGAAPDHMNPPQATQQAAGPSADPGWGFRDEAAVLNASQVLALMSGKAAHELGASLKKAARGLTPNAPATLALAREQARATDTLHAYAPQHQPPQLEPRGWTDLHRAAATGDEDQVELCFANARWLMAAGAPGALGLNEVEWHEIGRFSAYSAQLGSMLGSDAENLLATGRVDHGPTASWFKTAQYLAIKLQDFREARDAYSGHPADQSPARLAAWLRFENSVAEYGQTWMNVFQQPSQIEQLPLSHEARMRHLTALVELTGKMPGVDAADHEGNRPLDVAVARKHWSVAQLLMRRGSDPDHPNHAGITARDRWEQALQAAQMAHCVHAQFRLTKLLARLG